MALRGTPGGLAARAVCISGFCLIVHGGHRRPPPESTFFQSPSMARLRVLAARRSQVQDLKSWRMNRAAPAAPYLTKTQLREYRQLLKAYESLVTRQTRGLQPRIGIALETTLPDGSRVFLHGVRLWTLDEQAHRVDGPAIIAIDGTRTWAIRGHRAPPHLSRALDAGVPISLVLTDDHSAWRSDWPDVLEQYIPPSPDRIVPLLGDADAWVASWAIAALARCPVTTPHSPITR